jgi:predicted amino acid-binding ACT domain protein
MAISVKKIELWNVVVDNQPGALAAVLEPLAAAGADFEIVMGTAIPGGAGKASVGVFPVKGRKMIAAAKAAGLVPADSMPALLVVGDNRAGLGGRMSEAIAGAGINIGIAVAQVVGAKFSALFGFAGEEDARKAAALLKKVGATPARKSGKTAASAAAPRKKAPVARRTR